MRSPLMPVLLLALVGMVAILVLPSCSSETASTIDGGAGSGVGGSGSGGVVGTGGVVVGTGGVVVGTGGVVNGTGGVVVDGGADGRGAGGAQTFSCGSDTCVVGETYCVVRPPAAAGVGGMKMTSYGCATFPSTCTQRLDCTCFAPPFACGATGTNCSSGGGSVSVTCYPP